MRAIAVKLMFTFMLISGMISCGPSNKASSQVDNDVRDLIEGGVFEFRAQWVMPMNPGDMSILADAGLLRVGDSPNRINLLGNPNFLRIEGDTVSAYLPFYGEQQFNVNMTATDQAIIFDEVAKNYKVRYKEGKNQYVISFNASGNSSGYGVNLIVFANRSANLRVNSSNRSFISYQGEIRPLEEPEQD